VNKPPILVSLDGSAIAEAALPYAEGVATATGAPVLIVAVADEEPTRVLTVGLTPSTRAALVESLRDPLEAYINDTAEAVRARGVAASVRVVVGDPVDEILTAAENSGAAMIVMATHGRGGAARWLIGSVADKVMRLSSCPVLLVRPKVDEAPRDVALRRLMVPLDGSSLAEAALEAAAALAKAAGATVVLVRVEPWIRSTIGGEEYATYYAQADEAVAAGAQTYLAALCERVPAGVPVQTVLLRGSPGSSLIDFVNDHTVDLTVMSTHGRGGARRMVLGSTADRLVRAGVPTLLIHPAASSASVGPEHTGRQEVH